MCSDDPCMPDGKRREISIIEHRVSILQNELKTEMKKMKQAEQGQVGLWQQLSTGQAGTGRTVATVVNRPSRDR